MVKNPALGPLFSEALTALDEDALDDLLERRHAKALARELAPELQPLDPVQAARLEAALAPYCIAPGDVIARGRIARADLRPDASVRGASELRRKLEEGVGDAVLVDYLPVVAIATDNTELWRRWLKEWGARLHAWVADALVGDKPGRPLEEWIAPRCDSLAFDPGDEVTAWVQSMQLPLARSLHDTLTSYSPSFKPVTSPPEEHGMAGWSAGPGVLGGASGGPERRLTKEGIAEEQAARTVWGDAAETALLNWVVDNTRRLLARDGARNMLLDAFQAKSHTRALVERALDQGDLHAALRVSHLWSGAGFDLLGLEDGPGDTPVVTRYECKGLPREGRRVRVHLSRRELTVAREINGAGQGRWRLIAVETSGRGVDLTALAAQLLTKRPVPLEPLHELGFEPDGLRLVIERWAEGGAAPGG